jgi:hypothetical protein
MFVSVGKAAKVLGISASTMSKWDNEEKLKAERRFWTTDKQPY